MRSDARKLGGFLVPLTACLLLAGSTSRAAEPDPVQRSVKVMVNWDEQSMWRSQLMMRQRMKQSLDAATVRKVIEDGVDEHARAGIDRFVYCAWARFDSPVPGFKAAGYDARIREISPGFGALHEAGQDQITILRDRCHKHGMQFLVWRDSDKTLTLLSRDYNRTVAFATGAVDFIGAVDRQIELRHIVDIQQWHPDLTRDIAGDR